MFKWSDIDSRRFKLNTAKLIIEDQLADISPMVKIFHEKNGQLFIIRCNTFLTETIHQIQNAGFFLTDTMLTFSLSIQSVSLKKKYADKFEIVVARKGDSEMLGEIAKKAFFGYKGHYHQNPFLDDKLCDEIYVDWAKNLVTNKAMSDVVFIAKTGDKPIGFASLKVENRQAKAGLLGVIPEYRGMGISRVLHQERFLWCSKNSINLIRVESSISNKNYMNLLVKLGFNFHSSKYIFHLVHKLPESMT